MDDDQPTQAQEAPARLPGIALRRAFALLLDLGLIETLTSVAANLIVTPLPRAVFALIDGAIAFGWWSSSAWLPARCTTGMLFFGLEVRDASGAPAPLPAHLKRAAVMTLMFMTAANGDALTGGVMPRGVFYVWGGIVVGYACYAAFVLRQGPNVWLPHDQWSGAGVSRVGRVDVPQPIVPDRSSRRLAQILMALGAIAVLAVGGFGEHGYAPAKLLAPRREYFELTGTIERLVASVGLRSTVEIRRRKVWSNGTPLGTVLIVNVWVPWSAYSEEKDLQVARAIFGTIRVDPRECQAIRVTVGCRVSGVFGYSKVQVAKGYVDGSGGGWADHVRQ